MKAAPFRYHAPRSLAEALDLLGELGDDAKVLAGGQSLIPLLNYRLATPRHIVDIGRVAELSGWSSGTTGLSLRALVRQRDVELQSEIGHRCPLLRQAISHVGHVQVRNRGTVCGSLAHADPAAELPTVMAALGATMVAERRGERRTIDSTDFFRSYLTTALRPDEILTEVQVPDGCDSVAAFGEVASRRGDFALVGAAVVLSFRGDEVASARVVCSGVAPVPFRTAGAERALLDRPVDQESLLDAQRSTEEGMSPPEDIHATAAYRRRVAGVLVRRCVSAISEARKADRD